MSTNSKIAKTYTYHLGTKDYTIKNVKSLKSRVNHNIRKFQETNKNKSKDFEILKGSYDVVKDLKKIYKDEFDEAVEIYNADKRKSRKIANYFNHVDNDGKLSLAEEVILQYGDLDFWQDKTFDKKEMNKVFEKQIKTFENLYPNFKIASAVVHYDEASPHCQIIGIPILEMSNQEIEDWKIENVNTTNAWNEANPDKRPKKPQALILTKRIGKGAVFNKDNLSYGQNVMRNDMLDSLHKITIYDKDGINVAPKLDLLEKQEGRNYTSSVKTYKAVEDYKKTLNEESKVEVEKLKTVLIDENAKELANEKTLQQNKLNDDNKEVLKKLKEQQEKELKVEKLKFEEERKKKLLTDSKNQLLQQIQLNELIEEATGKKVKVTNEYINELAKTGMLEVVIEDDKDYNFIQINEEIIEYIDEYFEYDDAITEEENTNVNEEIIRDVTEYMNKVYDISVKLVTTAFSNMMSMASNIATQVSEKTKELTIVTASYDNKSEELDLVNKKLAPLKTQLDDVEKKLLNKNGELNKVAKSKVQEEIQAITTGVRKKILSGDELKDYIYKTADRISVEWNNGTKKFDATYKYGDESYKQNVRDLNMLVKKYQNKEEAIIEYSAYELENIDKYMLEGMASDFANQVISDTLYGYYSENIDEDTLNSRIGVIASRIGDNFGGSDTSTRIGDLEKLVKQATNSNKDRNGNIFGPNPWYIDPWDTSNDYSR